MTNAHYIAGAMEDYGDSAVSDVIARIGDKGEIITFIDIGAGMKLLKMSKYETVDGRTFKKKD